MILPGVCLYLKSIGDETERGHEEIKSFMKLNDLSVINVTLMTLVLSASCNGPFARLHAEPEIL